jgi:hypothetical protein
LQRNRIEAIGEKEEETRGKEQDRRGKEKAYLLLQSHIKIKQL